MQNIPPWIGISADANGKAMFKNLTVYQINPDWSLPLSAALEATGRNAFQECGPTQPSSAGFSAPRHLQHSPLIEVRNGHWIFEVTLQKRDLPSRVVNEALNVKLEQIFEQTGRRPSAKTKRELKEEVIRALLPKAFLKTDCVTVWLDAGARLLYVDSAKKSDLDIVTSLLCASFLNFYLKPLSTAQSMSLCVAAWLYDGEPPSAFTLDDECELKDSSEGGGTIRYVRHALDIDQVKAHLNEGKYPVKVAMTWQSRVQFVLTETLQLRKIGFLDVVLNDSGYDDGEAFDVSVAIVTTEFSNLIPSLVDALGGIGPDFAGGDEPEQEGSPSEDQHEPALG